MASFLTLPPEPVESHRIHRYEGEVPHVLPYFIAADEETQSVVVAIRGGTRLPCWYHAHASFHACPSTNRALPEWS